MCIIVFKDRGVPMPSEEVLSNCFSNNKDGAGIAIARGDCVQITKGYMTLKELLRAVEYMRITDDDVVGLHFRITTSGGTKAANCHPFPISSNANDLKARNITASHALLHNGILGAGARDMSDTMLFIKDHLAHKFLFNAMASKDADFIDYLKEVSHGSRLCLMYPDGSSIMTGEWKEKDGVKYSNTSYSYCSTYKYVQRTWWNSTDKSYLDRDNKALGGKSSDYAHKPYEHAGYHLVGGVWKKKEETLPANKHDDHDYEAWLQDNDNGDTYDLTEYLCPVCKADETYFSLSKEGDAPGEDLYQCDQCKSYFFEDEAIVFREDAEDALDIEEAAQRISDMATSPEWSTPDMLDAVGA